MLDSALVCMLIKLQLCLDKSAQKAIRINIRAQTASVLLMSAQLHEVMSTVGPSLGAGTNVDIDRYTRTHIHAKLCFAIDQNL